MALTTMLHDLLSPVLSDRTIMKLNSRGLLIDGPIKNEQLQPNSVDLTLGKYIKHIKHINEEVADEKIGSHVINKTIDPYCGMHAVRYETDMFDNGKYTIQPGEFVLMATEEVLNIPNGIVGIVCGRSSIARLGIQTEQAGFIDAGFHGTITLEMQNQTKYPIVIYEGMRIAQVYFLKAQVASVPYGEHKGSKYNGQIEPTGSMINLDREKIPKHM